MRGLHGPEMLFTLLAFVGFVVVIGTLASMLLQFIHTISGLQPAELLAVTVTYATGIVTGVVIAMREGDAQ